MSIPPLVCSTPPPPEQCDDDRDAEDFDIQYNLSQDDEDDGHHYNYGTYSDYIYSTSTSSNVHQDIWSSNISKKTDDKLSNDLLDEKKNTISVSPKNNSSIVNKVGFEDIVIEDLNLKVEDQNDEASLEHNSNKFDIEPFQVDCEKDLSKQNNTLIKPEVQNDEASLEHNLNKFGNEPVQSDCDKDLSIHTDIIEQSEESNHSTTVQNFNETSPVNDDEPNFREIKDHFVEETIVEDYTHESFKLDVEESNINKIDLESKTIDENSHNTTESAEFSTPVIEQKDVIATEHKHEDLSDDDFGEFDDFQFISSENNPPTTLTYCDNPWNNEAPQNSDFGDFTATFEVDNINLCKSSDNFDEKKPNEDEQIDTVIDGADDFGDFDDFKSSSADHKETTLYKTEPSQNVPVLSLHSPDNEIQIIESINSVLSSIFTSEISEVENSFEGKLESLLNETWGHLVDTDVRQSYIVNWNNSLGQKSLLKALCIDSRNILFGPKWNNSMPKYAANLTIAPLQPQKPVTPTNTRNVDEQNVDKATNKEPGSWTDPFTSDGQESCNPESENTGSATKPANLDVFTNAISPEMGHIYSSTLTVQPIRQINLPDTHIFTPTDSETPRSKTIHYDQVPAVLVPQPSEVNRQIDELTSNSKSEVSVQNCENDEDYWEFQDFKGSSGTNAENVTTSMNQVANKPNNGSFPQINNMYETQILQPIKIEPVAPALNWPNPGEVKETFDDFSEFISNTSWNNDNTNAGNQLDNHLNSKLEGGTETLEDDFETFQSAPTLKCTITPVDNTYQTTTNINHQNINDFPPHIVDTSDMSDTANSKTDGIISKQNLVRNETRHPGPNSFTTLKDVNQKISPVSSSSQNINSTVLQPSIATTTASQRNQQKTGQILQPLSLESYSQINWPSPGIDLQDLSRFNPVESLQSLKTDLSTGGSSKLASPAHKDITTRNDISDEDIWGDFVSSKPKQQQGQPKKIPAFTDDDEWTDFVSSPSVKPQNGLNTISLNVHTNLNMQKTLGPSKFHSNNNQLTLDIPTLKYVTPKSSGRGLYNEKHFQNL